MSVVVVLPVKRFAHAKQRLAEGGLRPSDRVALATGMLTDALEALRHCRRIDDVVVVTGDANAEVLARSYGAQVVADEPTAELDSDTAEVALAVLRARADAGGIVVLATHDPEVAARCDAEVHLVDGRLAVPALPSGG